MAFAKLTSKGQLTVPKEIREELGLRPGDHVSIVPNGGGTVTMRKALRIEDLFGRFPADGITATVEEMSEAAEEEAVEGVMHGMRP